MTRYIAFLRGINLGKRRLPMSRLRGLFEELGFGDVETFIASGNVLFSTKSPHTCLIESRIARHLENALGYSVDTFVRTMKEVAAIARAKFFSEDGNEEYRIHVGFLHRRLPRKVARTLEAVHTDKDEFRVVGREYYWLCRGLSSESKVWTLSEIKALKLPTSTMRNMTSIRKLVARHIDQVPQV